MPLKSQPQASLLLASALVGAWRQAPPSADLSAAGKGRAAARLYPEPGLRPSGDVDVCVRPSQLERAASALEDARTCVDLHAGLGREEPRDFDELYERADAFRLGETLVRAPGAEDHLRLLCLHMLRHGAWRPVWLCDVAAAVESRPVSFDWARFVGQDRRRERWLAC